VIELVPYEPSLSPEWDAVVDRARNGHFLYQRSYMDYHADRFPDASYLAREKGKAVAVVPGHLKGDSGWATHGGLTYGGMVLAPELSTPDTIEIFRGLNRALSARGIDAVFYKPLPWFHHQAPSEEDLYLLHRQQAVLESRSLSTVVPVHAPRELQRLRRRKIRGAREGGVDCRASDDLERFWPLIENRLGGKYGLKPVHSLGEMRHLASRFPEHIRFYGAYRGDELMAGCVVYHTGRVFHLQYLHASDAGRELGAPDLLVEWMIEGPARPHEWLSFGHSCENNGRYLNANLLFFKEGFGGRAVVLDEWRYDPRNDPFADA
jgi:hypothetical protein